jgi:hypothetical protein
MARKGGWQPVVLRFALAALLAGVAAFLVFKKPAAELEGDQPRYATLGLNLVQHGVFSSGAFVPDRKPQSSLAWAGPAIAAEVALAAKLHADTRTQLVCLALEDKSCRLTLPALRAMHLVEILVFLACLWSIGRAIFASEPLAWVTAALGLGFREVFEFANLVMTEPLFLMTYGLFAAALVRAVTAPDWFSVRPASWLLAGALLGLAVLVKPAAAVLLPLTAAGLIALAFVRARSVRPALLPVLCLVLPASVLVGLWIARSEVLFGSASLTDPVYLEASLSHRLAFNRMSWPVWAAGWLYYLPDFGDDLATALFGKAALAGLGLGPEGYYHYGFYVLHPAAHALTAPALATGYLVKTYMLGDPVKFLAVTALLTWRGLFVGRILGLAGLIALVIALWRMPQRQREPLALLAFLGFGAAFANGALSIGLARYNLALIPVYALSIAWAACRAFAAVQERLATRSGASGGKELGHGVA